jgi:Bacterial Ig-like domain (group 1)
LFWRILLAAVVCAIADCWVAVGAAQAAQLPGEILIADSSAGDRFDFQFNCNSDGSGTVSYSVSGRAIAQYTSLDGHFEESGTFEFDASGHLAAFGASFTITGNDGTVVSGTKALDTSADAAIAVGVCSSDPSGSCSTSMQGAPFTYEATFGGDVERGTGVVFDLSAFQPQCGGATSGTFEEDFLATDAAPPQPTTLTLSPSSAVNPLDEPHTVTATLLDQYGAPIADYSVDFTLSGSAGGSGSCITDILGQCQYTFSPPLFPGVVTISACSDAFGDGVCEPDSAVATATKTYVLPTSTAGKVSGDGKIGAVAISFNAKSDTSGTSGTCKIVSSTFTAKCLDVLAYVESGSSATFYGHATIDGVQTLYRIQVTDASKSGAGDAFSFTTGTGYSVSGTLTQGNLKVQ